MGSVPLHPPTSFTTFHSVLPWLRAWTYYIIEHLYTSMSMKYKREVIDLARPTIWSLIIYALRRYIFVWVRFLHRKWSCISRTLGDDMLAARCLMLNSYLIDRYFSVHLTTNIGDVKLSTNVVYGRNGLCIYISYVIQLKSCKWGRGTWLLSGFWNSSQGLWCTPRNRMSYSQGFGAKCENLSDLL